MEDYSKDSVSPILLDVGGTFIKCGDGREIPIDSNGSRDEIRASLKAAAGTVSKGTRIAIAIPGAFDYRKGIFLMKHKFAAVYGEKFQDIILDGTGLTEKDVCFRFIHDVNCMLLGEIRCGAAQGKGNTALVSLGTGLGFAMFVDGEILETDLKSPAVSIYSIPFRDGILEDYASKRGIISSYLRHAGIGAYALTVKEIADRAHEGDKAALAAFHETASVIGNAISPILTRYNIKCLLFGGQICRSFDLMNPVLKDALRGIPSLEHISTISDFGNATFNGLRNSF